jgi:hypothetical protein
LQYTDKEFNLVVILILLFEKLGLSPSLYGEFFLYDKVKLHSVECFLHGMLVPQGYDLKGP